MKPSARHLAWLLPLLLTACFHRTKDSQNQPFAPSIEELQPKTVSPLPSLPSPVVTLASQTPAPETKPEQPPQKTPKPPVKRKKPVNASPQQASNAASESPGVSAIGRLSSGDSSDLRDQTIDSITAIERGLNGINRSLGDQEKKTAAQIPQAGSRGARFR
jgi:outer membrane biosynthesis protein TonB